MTTRAPTDTVPDPEPPQEEGSLVTFLALLEAECERSDAHPLAECSQRSES